MPDALLSVTQVAPYLTGPAGVHGVLEQAAVGVAQIAEVAGLRATQVPDVRDIPAGELERARALALFTIGETPWSDAQKATVTERLRSGELAVLAIHSATDACYSWPEYRDIVGARFNGHPWTQAMELDVVDGDHPATSHLGPTWAWTDEVYQFREIRPDAHVLLRLPPEQLDLERPGVKQPPEGFPLSWCFSQGAGRVFSTSLGHFPAAWESPTYLQHLVGGLQWALTA